MRLRRIPQRVSNCLSPFSSNFYCPQGQHFRVWCWLLVTLLLVDGSARLKNLTRLMPASLRYWTVRRMVNAGYWNGSAAFDELVVATFFALPPPTDGTLYLIGDKTIKQKSGKKQPLAHKTRMNEFARYVFGQEIVLLIAQWGRLRVPVSCEMLDPKRKGHQNILFRQMLRRFRPPAWCRQRSRGGGCRLCLQAQFADDPAIGVAFRLRFRTHLETGRRHTSARPGQIFAQVAVIEGSLLTRPIKRRRDYWVFVRRAQLKTVGDVTVILSKRRRNEGPKKIKLIVTNLETKRASEILNAYARRWAVEVTFKELKSGLHWGQMQVTKEKERVKRAMLLPVMAYLLLLRLYGKRDESESRIHDLPTQTPLLRGGLARAV